MIFPPETNNRADWPRLVRQAFQALDRRATRLEAAADWSALGDYADDTAAAAGGVAVGQLYRNGSVVMVRVA